MRPSADISTALPGGATARHTWTLPLVFSQADPRALYFSDQFLFKTMNGGESWAQISPDLTREDPGVPPNLDEATAADAPEGLMVWRMTRREYERDAGSLAGTRR